MNDTSSRIDVKVCTDVSRPRDQGHIYVQAQQGRWQRLRRQLGWGLMLLFLAGPWLRWNGAQAILLDWEAQRFHLFGMTIWPQDLTLLALLLMVAAFALFLSPPGWDRSGAATCVRKRYGPSGLSGWKKSWKAVPTGGGGGIRKPGVSTRCCARAAST
ncbi:hypothetical protein MBH78_18395 [Oceanimonas sp. NS1]|nr:hypothetical protein [Oceanimonas sp. NS1]